MNDPDSCERGVRAPTAADRAISQPPLLVRLLCRAWFGHLPMLFRENTGRGDVGNRRLQSVLPAADDVGVAPHHGIEPDARHCPLWLGSLMNAGRFGSVTVAYNRMAIAASFLYPSTGSSMPMVIIPVITSRKRGLGALEFKPTRGPKVSSSTTAIEMSELVESARRAVTGEVDSDAHAEAGAP